MTGWNSAPGESRPGDQEFLKVQGTGVEVTGWSSAPGEMRLGDQVLLQVPGAGER